MVTVQKRLRPSEAAALLGVGYGTLKRWIYDGYVRSEKTRGGHHRVPESEILRMVPNNLRRNASRSHHFEKISGRNELIGRVVDIKYDDLLAQVTVAVDQHQITSIIAADIAKDLRLKPGDRVAAVVKSTEVTVLAIETMLKKGRV